MKLSDQDLKPRPRYLETLLRTRKVDAIKVLVGMRRCGKSSILELFRRELVRRGVPEDHVVALNFESASLMGIRTAHDLVDEVLSRTSAGGHYVLLLDEVQTVDEWERAVDSFRVDLDAEIYITGSNAYLLSSKLSTLLSGRTLEIPVHPLSYAEYLAYAGLDSSAETFERYLRLGGLPPVVDQLDDEHVARMMLSGIYDTIFLKDVASQIQVRNIKVFQDITTYLAATVGTNVSITNVENYLRSAHRKASNEVVERYLDALIDANLFGRVRRWDIHGRQYLQGLEKYYPLDLGIRSTLTGFAPGDVGYSVENFVYCELVRRGFDVSVGKQGAAEVDFVACKDGEVSYVQVTATLLASDRTRERELAPLVRIGSDAGRRFILTMDDYGLGNVGGIELKNVVAWALDW